MCLLRRRLAHTVDDTLEAQPLGSFGSRLSERFAGVQFDLSSYIFAFIASAISLLRARHTKCLGEKRLNQN